MEDGRKTIHGFFKQRLNGFRRHIAAGKTRAACGDDDIDTLVGNPALHDFADFFDIILHNPTGSEFVARTFQTRHKRIARFIFSQRTRVGDRQHSNIQRNEGQAFINAGHVYLANVLQESMRPDCRPR